MTGKELYSLHEGKRAVLEGNEGIICGYDDDSLIMAVTSGYIAWFDPTEEEYISDEYKNHPKGFLFVNVYNILRD